MSKGYSVDYYVRDAAVAQAQERCAADPSLTDADRQRILKEEMHSIPGGVAYYDYTFSVPRSVSVYWMAALIDAAKAREAGDVVLAAACDAEAAAIIGAVEAASDAMTARVEDRLYVRTGYHSAATGEWHQVARAAVKDQSRSHAIQGCKELT